MSIAWIVVVGACVVLAGGLALLVILVFTPVVITVDSGNRRVRARWLGILEYGMPLPGAGGEKKLTVAGKAIHVFGRERKRAARKPRRPEKGRARAGRFLWRCLGDAAVRRRLAGQLAAFFKRVVRAFALTRSGKSISLPDPASNGVLAGLLAQSGWGRRLGIGVNFSGGNRLFLEFRLYPHRVLMAALFFLSGMPYRAMFRHWRASA